MSSTWQHRRQAIDPKEWSSISSRASYVVVEIEPAFAVTKCTKPVGERRAAFKALESVCSSQSGRIKYSCINSVYAIWRKIFRYAFPSPSLFVGIQSKKSIWISDCDELKSNWSLSDRRWTLCVHVVKICRRSKNAFVFYGPTCDILATLRAHRMQRWEWRNKSNQFVYRSRCVAFFFYLLSTKSPSGLRRWFLRVCWRCFYVVNEQECVRSARTLRRFIIHE